MTQASTSTFARRAVTACLLAAVFACCRLQAQETAPPPQLQRLLEVAQDPAKVRELMKDPQKMLEAMESLESKEVQDYLSDPQRVMELMRSVDLLKIREAMQEV